MNFRSMVPVALAALVFLPAPAPADPPPWAPAHGWRAKHGDDERYEHRHKKHKHKHKHRHDEVRYEHRHAPPPVIVDADDYHRHGRAVGIDQGTCHKAVVGGLVGAAAGGFLGSKVGKGDGQLAATAAGTVLGYLIGSSVGRTMDQVDQNCVGQALERAPDQRTVAWRDPDQGADYSVTPTRTFQEAGRYCRDYVMNAVVGGEPTRVFGTACRNPDGTWTRS